MSEGVIRCPRGVAPTVTGAMVTSPMWSLGYWRLRCVSLWPISFSMSARRGSAAAKICTGTSRRSAQV